MPLQDITGTLLRIIENYREKDAVGATDHPLVAVSPLLQTPLSSMFDQFWNATVVHFPAEPQPAPVPEENATQHDHAVQVTVAKITAQGGSKINGTFPTTGTLQCGLGAGTFDTGILGGEVKGNLTLIYSLPGASFTFNKGLTAWRLTFDLALEYLMDVPDLPGPITAAGRSIVSNAKFSPDNVAASVAEDVANLVFSLDSILLGVPIQTIAGSVESGTDQATELPAGPVNTLLNQLQLVFSPAVRQGFLHLRAGLDSAGLLLRLTHPIDPAPEVIDSRAIPKFKGQQILVASQSQIKPGGSLTATGSFFTAGATAVELLWNATTSGAPTESDIQWRSIAPGSPPQLAVSHVTEFTITGLAANTTIEASVRNCDQLTCTDFSAPVLASTTASDRVDLSLQSGSASVLVGQTLLQPGGTFSLPVTIPASTSPGVYLLRATVGDEVAAAPITVFGSSETVPPLLLVIAADTNEPSRTQPAEVIEQENVSVRGEDFAPGAVQLAAESGQQLGTATALATGEFQGTFLWPAGVLGNHRIIASQIVGGVPTEQANAAVFAQALAR